MFVNFFIQRPVFATVCALLILLGGIAVIPTLPIAQFPNLAPPQVGVTSVYIGASAQTVESAVTIPIEQQINGAEGMKYVTSTSGNDGTSSSHRHVRSEPRSRPGHRRHSKSREHRAGPAARSGKGRGHHDGEDFAELRIWRGRFRRSATIPTLFISNYLDVYVRDSLKRIPGVADVIIFGERKYSMRLWLDPGRMTGRALTATDVHRPLAAERGNCRGASWAAACRSRAGLSGQRACGRPLSEPEQFDNIILKTNADGTIVRLRDVGHAGAGSRKLRQ